MLKIGHRGAKGYAPENTRASLKKALDLGVDAVEFDVYMIQDGSVVLMHDKFLNRTTNGKGLITNKTLEQLQQLDAGNGEKIPTLQEALDLINHKALVNIELKGKNTAAPVATIIKEYILHKKWKYSDFTVSSFDHGELQKFKKELPQVKLGALIIGILLQFDKYEKLGAYSLNMWSKLIRKSIIEEAHRRGLQVFVYTVNNPKKIARMKALGVDGIISDFPDRI